ncbi:MAG: ABC transporter permease [Rummeliibacillus sp.]
MNLILLIKMNIKQYLGNYFMVCILFIATPIILWMGYVFSSESTILKYNVGVEISEQNQSDNVRKMLEESGRFSCTLLDADRKEDEIKQHGYVAIVTMAEDNTLEVRSEDNQVIASEILWRLGGMENNVFHVSTFKKTVGFLIVFILMASKLLQGMHYIERENGVLVRLLSGNVSSIEYLVSQLIANFIEIAIPVMLSTVIYSLIFPEISKWNMGDILNIEFIISMLASSFSFFIFYSFQDKMTIEFVSSLMILITSIVGGCLIDLKDTNQVVAMIRGVLPQKIILNMIDKVEWSTYVVFSCWLSILILVGIIKGRKVVCKK